MHIYIYVLNGAKRKREIWSVSKTKKNTKHIYGFNQFSLLHLKFPWIAVVLVNLVFVVFSTCRWNIKMRCNPEWLLLNNLCNDQSIPCFELLFVSITTISVVFHLKPSKFCSALPLKMNEILTTNKPLESNLLFSKYGIDIIWFWAFEMRLHFKTIQLIGLIKLCRSIICVWCLKCLRLERILNQITILNNVCN